MKQTVEEVKAWLREAREASGHSQASLARTIGVSVKTINSLESEREVGLGQGLTLYAVMEELGLLRDEQRAVTTLEAMSVKLDELIALGGAEREVSPDQLRLLRLLERVEERLRDGGTGEEPRAAPPASG